MALQQHKTFAAYEAACSLKGWVSKMAQKVKDACCDVDSTPSTLMVERDNRLFQVFL